MAAISARLGVNFGQLGPNFGPTWIQDGATWPQFGQLRPKLESYGVKMEGIAGPIRNPQSANFHQYFPHFLAVDDASSEALSPYVPHVGPNVARSCRQKVPSCGRLELSWISMCIKRLQFGIYLDQFGATTLARTWDQLCGRTGTLKSCKVTAVSDTFWLW